MDSRFLSEGFSMKKNIEKFFYSERSDFKVIILPFWMVSKKHTMDYTHTAGSELC